MRLGQVPVTHVDPTLVANRYPTSSNPALSNEFVAPDLRRTTTPNLQRAGGGLVLLGIAGVAIWLSMRR